MKNERINKINIEGFVYGKRNGGSMVITTLYSFLKETTFSVVTEVLTDFVTTLNGPVFFVSGLNARGNELWTVQIHRDDWENHRPLWEGVIRSYLPSDPIRELKQDFLKGVWKVLYSAERRYWRKCKEAREGFEDGNYSYDTYEGFLDMAHDELYQEYAFLWDVCYKRGLDEREFAPMFPEEF